MRGEELLAGVCSHVSDSGGVEVFARERLEEAFCAWEGEVGIGSGVHVRPGWAVAAKFVARVIEENVGIRIISVAGNRARRVDRKMKPVDRFYLIRWVEGLYDGVVPLFEYRVLTGVVCGGSVSSISKMLSVGRGD